MKKVLNNPLVVGVLVVISLVMVYMNIRSIWSDETVSNSSGSTIVEREPVKEGDFVEESVALSHGEKNLLHESKWEIQADRNPFLLGSRVVPVIEVKSMPTLTKAVVKEFASGKGQKVTPSEEVEQLPKVQEVVDRGIKAILHGAKGSLVLVDNKKLSLGDSYRGGVIEDIGYDAFIVLTSGNRVKYKIDSIGGVQ